jgi:hypothetical protein
VALRWLVRAAPFVLGALAAAIWVRRRQTLSQIPPAPETPALPARSTRFVRRPVDIVTVVDDLLAAPR